MTNLRQNNNKNAPVQITEGKLVFTFPAGWDVTKYDGWQFYKDKFKDCCCGNKAVDFLALGKNNVLWLIEVKDYREHKREKEISLWDEMAIKARDTLAGLFSAKIDETHDNNPYAQWALNSSKLRVVLHLEQPAQHSKLFPRSFNIANVQNKIKQLVKPIDAHPIVLEQAQMRSVAWSVRSLGADS